MLKSCSIGWRNILSVNLIRLGAEGGYVPVKEVARGRSRLPSGVHFTCHGQQNSAKHAYKKIGSKSIQYFFEQPSAFN